jgi:hypothetical protein
MLILIGIVIVFILLDLHTNSSLDCEIKESLKIIK